MHIPILIENQSFKIKRTENLRFLQINLNLLVPNHYLSVYCHYLIVLSLFNVVFFILVNW